VSVDFLCIGKAGRLSVELLCIGKAGRLSVEFLCIGKAGRLSVEFLCVRMAYTYCNKLWHILHVPACCFQNEMLQDTVAQRAQMFESLSGSEREQLAQYQILKDTLDNVNQELAQKHAQVRDYRCQKQALLE